MIGSERLNAYKVVSFRGREFKIVRGTTHPQYSYDSFEIEEKDIREKYWNVGPGHVVVDVGASYGSYTLTACAMGAKDVYAFEPEPTVFKDLVANLNLNGWFPRPCVPFPLGLWSAPTKVSMKSYAPHWPPQTITGEYEMTTLDKVDEQAKFDRLDWMKVDVEGAEVSVLVGAFQTIRKFHPKMLIECHTFLDNEMVQKVEEILLPLDYKIEEIDRPPCTTLYAR